MVKKILVPVDGSEHATKAVEFAASMAKEYDATLHILHVVKKREIPKGLQDYIEREGIKESPCLVRLELIAKKSRQNGTGNNQKQWNQRCHSRGK